ncbi:MAG: cytochrome C oxidase subunit IV [SAR202 cluster bacterium]|jgi:cytochrome c oxidase subunit 4|nr:cytochrome C oxidase subunit IV [SAR202 cluster bacterium]|tara:strand:- start:1881 stop:2198 length:318 start_codon:yes stop_codon:yes gene_type:complete
MQNNENAPVEQHDSDHPTPAKYIQIAVILTLITAFEVAIYYVDAISKEAFIAIFIGMSVVKFIIVAMFYMHLKFDSRLFTYLFIAGLILATGILLVLGTLFRIFT